MSENLNKLRELTEKLSKIPRKNTEFYDTVSKLSKISPEDGYELLDNAAIGVHLVDKKGTILWANVFELNTLKYSPDEYFGKSIVDFHLDSNIIKDILNTLAGGGRLDAYPARLKAKDGSIVYVLINSNVFTKDKDFIHTRCFTIQISKSTYSSLKNE